MDITQNKLSLDQLRKEIDSIDSEIFNLLLKRLSVVKKVGELKKSNQKNRSIIRPAREASMVRNIYNKAKKEGLNENISIGFAYLWRQIISVSVNFEEATNICYNKNNKCGLNKAKEYLGIFSEYKDCNSDEEVFTRLENQTSNIAIFSTKPNQENFEKPWWLLLSEKYYNISIFAGFPFFKKQNENEIDLEKISKQISLVALSNITPEPSGRDIFVYVLKGNAKNILQDNFIIIDEYNDYKLLFSLENYSSEHSENSKNYNLKYLGCFAVF
ncbi:MAG: chorismate mutase [Rickettsiales bacterium]|nr:chorismate mutase [Rickettsiales bacterium]